MESSFKNDFILLRDEFVNWVGLFHKNASALNNSSYNNLYWNGMASWWTNKLMLKDSFNDNGWLNRMYIFYLMHKYKGLLEIDTDDTFLIKILNKKYSSINKHSNFSEHCLLFIHFLKSFVCNCLLIIVAKSISGKNNLCKEKLPSVIFRTHYPIEWLNNNLPRTERLFGDAVYHDLKKGLSRSYFTILHSNFFCANPLKLLRRYRDVKTLSSSDIKHIISQSFLSFFELITVYYKTITEYISFLKLIKNTKFQTLFYINGISYFNILIKEWFKTYHGYQQNSRLEAISISNLLSFFKSNETKYIITYGELFAHNRSTYHLSKKNNSNVIFISIQHAMNAKNKLFTYHSPHEFNFYVNELSSLYSPYPDFFLTQGEKYTNILSEFYESKRIHIIGSLKNLQVKDRHIPLLKDFQQNGFKIILITPSLGYDYRGLVDLFSQVSIGSNYRLVLTFHPAMVVKHVITYQQTTYPDLDINYLPGISTYSLLHYATLVVAGYSTILFEASILGKNVVSYLPLGSLPQFDHDPNIPFFSNPFDFQIWFDSFIEGHHSTCPYKVKQIERDYFYKNDSNAGKRLWDFILKLENKTTPFP